MQYNYNCLNFENNIINTRKTNPMHEISLAANIINIATEEAKKVKATAVKEIDIEVGKLSGVVIDSLEFALEEGLKETILENAKLNVFIKKGKAICNNCKHKYTVEEEIAICPACQDYDATILEGKELLIKSLKLEY